MSLTRQFFREFRPLFRMLEEPLGRHPGFAAMPGRAFFDDPFFTTPFAQAARPAIDLSEEGNQYVIEAELPGVKKEDIDIRIGDGGRSLTIEGKIVQRSTAPTAAEEVTDGATAATSEGTQGCTSAIYTCTELRLGAESSSTAVTQSGQPSNQLTTERSFSGSTTFTRTVYLPRPVNASGVSARLADGILTLRIPKAEEPGSVKINIE